MFDNEPEPDLSLIEWEACRDYYLQTSQEPGLPDNLVAACHLRARRACERVRVATREVEEMYIEFIKAPYRKGNHEQ